MDETTEETHDGDAQLRERADILRAVTESTTDAIYVKNTVGRYLMVNPVAARIMCTPAEEIVGKDDLSFFIADNARVYMETDRRIMNSGEAETLEEVVSVNGESRTYLSTKSPYRDATGRVIGLIGISTDITERKRAEARVQESEEQFRTLADSIPQLAWMADADGFIFWYNRRWYDYTGTTLEEMQGWGWQKVHDPNEVERVTERFKQALDTGEAWEDIFPLRRGNDGEFRRFLSRALPIRNAEGRIVRWFGTNTDVEEQLRAEERLKHSEERFRTMIGQSPVSIQVLAPDGRTTEVNEAWEKLWGVALNEIGDYNLLEDEQLRAKGIMPYIKRAFAGEPQKIPPVLYNPDETIPDKSQNEDPARWTQAVVYPVKDEQGQVREVVLMHEDITERKRAEANLEASDERYRALADAMPQLVWATDEMGAHFYYNQQWYDYTGLTEEESLGYGFANALHTDDKERALKRWERAWAGGEGYTIEYRFYSRPQGVYRWFLGRATPVRDHEGKIYQWVGTCTDIDEQKEMEAQMARMSEGRERMLEEVSTPVVPVLPGVLALPLVGSLDTERMQRATDAALSEVMRTGAHTFIIDITGARIIDSHAVANLGNLVGALRLIGADAIVTGVTAQAAQTLVGLGLDLSNMRTHRTLAQALAAVASRNHFQGVGSRSNGTTINTR